MQGRGVQGVAQLHLVMHTLHSLHSVLNSMPAPASALPVLCLLPSLRPAGELFSDDDFFIMDSGLVMLQVRALGTCSAAVVLMGACGGCGARRGCVGLFFLS